MMNSSQKILLEIVAIAIGILALVIAVLNWLVPFNPVGPSPFIFSKTPVDDIAATASLFDNFDNPSFDGRYDTNLWLCDTCDSQDKKVYQQGSVLHLDVSGTAKQTGIELRSNSQWDTGRLVSLQGKLQLNQQSSSGTIWFSVAGAGCYINGTTNGPVLQCAYAHENDWEYTSNEIPVNADTWYTIRVDFDTRTQTWSYFLNDELVGTHTPRKLNSAGSITFGVTTGDNTSIRAYIDDIALTSAP